jgi:hypothetical protein
MRLSDRDIQAQSSSQTSPKHSRPKLFSFRTDGLNLHKLPAEPPFDAKIAMSHTVVERRGHAHDLAFLLMHGDVAAYAAISRMPIMLASIAFCVLAPLGWPEESGFPGPAKFEPPDHNTILIIGKLERSLRITSKQARWTTWWLHVLHKSEALGRTNFPVEGRGMHGCRGGGSARLGGQLSGIGGAGRPLCCRSAVQYQ